MVRFIIYLESSQKVWAKIFTFQYGQIYYQYSKQVQTQMQPNLHSNMVRFIILAIPNFITNTVLFTFQYGQIYYILSRHSLSIKAIIYIPIWLDLLFVSYSKYNVHVVNLHSNMVRFIIYKSIESSPPKIKFTFQYGQIYYI